MPAWIVIVEKKICNNFKTFGNGEKHENLQIAIFQCSGISLEI
jgi:hypothetical protein